MYSYCWVLKSFWFILVNSPWSVAAAAAKSLQSCPTLCDPMDCSLLGFSVHGILRARTLEWVGISFSNAWKWKVKVKFLSRVQLLAIPWTAAYQALPSMGFSRQQYWSGVPLPSPDQICLLQIFSPIWNLSSLTIDIIFLRAEVFNFNEVHPACQLFLSWIMPLILHLKSHNYTQGHLSFLLHYPLGVS